MYTQCPNCGAAFRVTAEVLRVAGGRVRCGSCGVAFNALNHLSEQRPEAAAPPAAEGLPELYPEAGGGEPEALPAPTGGSELDDTDIGMPFHEAGDADDRPGDPGSQNGRDTLLDARLSAELATPRVDEVLSNTPTPLDEVLTDVGQAAVDSAEVFAPEAAATTPDSELRFDDHTGLPDDYESGDDEAPAPVPEPNVEAPAPLSSLEVDLSLDDPDEWRDILAEVGPEAAAGSPAQEPPTEPPPEAAPESAALDVAPTDASGAMTLEEELDALDVDLDEEDSGLQSGAELVNQMEALSLELSGLQEELDLLSEQAAEPTIADELAALEIELEEDEPEADEAEAAAPEAAAEDAPDAEDTETDAGDAVPPAAEPPAAEASAETSLDEDLVAAAFEAEAREAPPAAEPEESFRPPVVEAPTEHVVPPQTEEEETINRLIDQDLLALAVEDEDGMASTIAMEESDDRSDEFAAFADMLPEDASSVETIIMEGETARSGDALDEAAESERDEPVQIPAAVAAEVAEPAARNWRMIGGAAALIVLLALQGVHFSRHALATVPGLHGILEPVYAAIGQPLNPAWDVTGWRFEATRGSTDEAGETLTIYSRIGNNSDAALPYPVISVALTDRFEETIGSRVLEPADYLGEDVDSGRLVPAGTTFNASIAIDSPAAEAMGFKLNVCYRQTGDRLRCAIEDFRD